jgi:hypothetical protein
MTPLGEYKYLVILYSSFESLLGEYEGEEESRFPLFRKVDS